MKKWGVLYCPKTWGLRPHKNRWEKIKACLDKHGIDYDFVQSENTESVERLMKMLINNGYKTIIIVGGDSALNDAVNCLMDVSREVRESISLGIIPNGIMNDFAKYWGFEESEPEQTVEWLSKHRVRKVDLGCVRYTDRDGKPRQRYFINCVNIGLIAAIMNLRSQTRRIFGSRTLSYITSFVLMLFQRLEYKMNICINSETIKRKVMTLCIGSARGYGQTPRAVPYNGMLDVSLVYHTEMMQFIEGLYLFIRGRFLNHKSVHPYRTREVIIEEAHHALVGVDGRLIEKPVGPFKVTIELEVVNFLIPV